jgi:hypothetical protein
MPTSVSKFLSGKHQRQKRALGRSERTTPPRTIELEFENYSLGPVVATSHYPTRVLFAFVNARATLLNTCALHISECEDQAAQTTSATFVEIQLYLRNERAGLRSWDCITSNERNNTKVCGGPCVRGDVHHVHRLITWASPCM